MQTRCWVSGTMSDALLDIVRRIPRPTVTGNKCNLGNGTSFGAPDEAPLSPGWAPARYTNTHERVTRAFQKSHAKSGLDGPVTPVTRVTPLKANWSTVELFEERAAIRQYDGGLSRYDAEIMAANELGFAKPEDLFLAVVDEWQIMLRRAAHLGQSPQLVAAAQNAIKVWGAAALRAGWTDYELFGFYSDREAHGGVQAFGLVFSILGGWIVGLTPEEAIICDENGIRRGVVRRGPTVNPPLLFWEHAPSDVTRYIRMISG